MRGFEVCKKSSNVDGVEPPERVKVFEREWCWVYTELVNTGK